MKSATLIAVFLVVYINQIIKGAPTCGENEISVTCAPGKKCEPSCENPAGLQCPRQCDGPGCQCASGFVRNVDGFCIQESDCPRIFADQTDSCGVNEMSTACAPQIDCQETCLGQSIDPCTLNCFPGGCICETGFVRLSPENITCVERSSCPKPIERTSEIFECGPNEQWNKCANQCKNTCNGGCSLSDPKSCVGGCVCISGYARTSKFQGGKCIPCKAAPIFYYDE